MSGTRNVKSEREKKYALNLGRWIHDSRLAVGLSMQALADAIEVHRNTIWRWESGGAIPNACQLDLISSAIKRAEVAQ